jgi:hypothetical protein
MVNVPRYTRKLASKIAALGGVDYLVVTSRGLELGHERWKEAFPGLTRIVHRHDAVAGNGDAGGGGGGVAQFEQVLDGYGPWELERASSGISDNGEKDEDENDRVDLRITHVPGHTFGSLALWFQPMASSSASAEKGKDGVGKNMEEEAVLFTGASLGVVRRKGVKRGTLDGLAGMNDGDVKRQARSLRTLVNFPPSVQKDRKAAGEGAQEGAQDGESNDKDAEEETGRAIISSPSLGQVPASEPVEVHARPWRWILSAFGAPTRLGDEGSGAEEAQEEVRRLVLEVADQLETRPLPPYGL